MKNEQARIRAMKAIARTTVNDKMAERDIKGYIEYLEMTLLDAIDAHETLKEDVGVEGGFLRARGVLCSDGDKPTSNR